MKDSEKIHILGKLSRSALACLFIENQARRNVHSELQKPASLSSKNFEDSMAGIDESPGQKSDTISLSLRESLSSHFSCATRMSLASLTSSVTRTEPSFLSPQPAKCRPLIPAGVKMVVPIFAPQPSFRSQQGRKRSRLRGNRKNRSGASYYQMATVVSSKRTYVPSNKTRSSALKSLPYFPGSLDESGKRRNGQNHFNCLSITVQLVRSFFAGWQVCRDVASNNGRLERSVHAPPHEVSNFFMHSYVIWHWHFGRMES